MFKKIAFIFILNIKCLNLYLNALFKNHLKTKIPWLHQNGALCAKEMSLPSENLTG